MYITFAERRPDVVFSNDPVKDVNKPRCTSRSLTEAGKYHTMGLGDTMALPSDAVTQAIVAGHVGDAAAAQMFAFFKVADELPEIAEMESTPMLAKVPSAERIDAHFAAAQMVVYHANKDNVDNLFTYATRLNKELQTTIAKQLLAKGGGSLLNSKVLGKWIVENPALITNSLAD